MIKKVISVLIYTLLVSLSTFYIYENFSTSFGSIVGISFMILILVSICLIIHILFHNYFKNIIDKYRSFKVYRYIFGGFWFYNGDKWIHHTELDDLNSIKKMEYFGDLIKDDESNQRKIKRNSIINKILYVR